MAGWGTGWEIPNKETQGSGGPYCTDLRLLAEGDQTSLGVTEDEEPDWVRGGPDSRGADSE